MTEGEKAINIKLSLSLLPSRLRRATFLVRGRLYFHIIVNLIAPESSSVFVNSHGGSKPPPYTVGYNFSLRAKYQLLRILTTAFQPPLCKGCGSPVETSAFNAEAPTEPAGETVGCRRQLGGIVRSILYDFVKIPQSFFCSKKTTAPSSEGACVCAKFSICYILKVIINTSIPTAVASHRPTLLDI